MAYKGTTLNISFADSALNFSKNQDALPSFSLVDSSKNINIVEGGISSRNGSSVVDTLPANAVPLSIFHYKTFVLRFCDDGSLYKDSTTTIAIGMNSSFFANFAVMNDKLYIAFNLDRPKTWNGVAASTSDLTNLSADWTGSNWPAKFIVYGSGNSERMWACGCSGTKYSVYYSVSNNGSSDANFNGAGSGQIYIDTGDNIGIVGLFIYNKQLWAVGRNNIYQILATDIDPTKWSYIRSPWKGGAYRDNLIVVTPNDIIAMMEDGEIYSILATQTAQNYTNASLTRPSFIHNFIKKYVDLSQIGVFHGLYDPNLRAIRFFLSTVSGGTFPTICLLYFIDRPVDKAWVLHDYDHPVYCSALVNLSPGVIKVYIGGPLSRTWFLEDTSVNSDNSLSYKKEITTAKTYCGNPRVRKFFDSGILRVVDSSCTLTIKIYIDNVLDSTVSKVVTSDMKEVFFPIGAEGEGISFNIYSDSAGDKFFFSGLLVDFVNLGAGVI